MLLKLIKTKQKQYLAFTIILVLSIIYSLFICYFKLRSCLQTVPVASGYQQLCVLLRTGRHQYRRAITSCLKLMGAGSTPPKFENGFLGILAIII